MVPGYSTAVEAVREYQVRVTGWSETALIRIRGIKVHQ